MKKIILFLIAVAFLTPQIAKGDDPPTINSLNLTPSTLAGWVEHEDVPGDFYPVRGVNVFDELTLLVEAEDDNGIDLIQVWWGDGGYDSKSFNGKDIKKYYLESFGPHTYSSPSPPEGYYTILVTVREALLGTIIFHTEHRVVSEELRVKAEQAEEEIQVDISVPATPTPKVGVPVPITVNARDTKGEGIIGINISYDDDTEDDYNECPGTPSCESIFKKTYTLWGNHTVTVKAKVKRGGQEIFSREYDYSFKVARKGDLPDNGGTVGDLVIGPLNLPNPFCDDEGNCEVKSFSDLINKLIKFVFTLAIIIFPILLIVAGIMFLTAGGDPAKIKNAKNLILYAVIGFAIIALARLFVELIQEVFGVKPPEGG